MEPVCSEFRTVTKQRHPVMPSFGIIQSRSARIGERMGELALNVVSATVQGETRVRSGVEVASLSDLGCQRENNEDRYCYWEPTGDDEFQQKGRLAVIADGMGGYEGGQEASRLAVEIVQDTYANTSNCSPQTLLLAGFEAAHAQIQQQASDHPGLRGMGTTCTAIALLDHQLVYAHVGDSRLYLLRGDNISRISHDHSYVGRLVENGVISPEEAESHPQRHILTAALGAGSGVTPEHPPQPIAVAPDDVLVLCTDGLWSVVHDEEMAGLIRENSLNDACRALVDKARQRGGPDNITVQLLRIVGNGSARPSAV